MLNLPAEWAIEKIPLDDDRLALVERIVQSKRFHRAPQLRDILAYVVARSLSEDSATITEQEIGSTVLGRGADFDPGHDNIVRAQMRHLRIKLDEYFENEGKSEPLILTIPKGHYVASFDDRPKPDAATQTEEPIPPAGLEAGRPRAGRIWTGLALAALSVAVVALWLRTQPVDRHEEVPAEYSFYREVLGPVSGGVESETSLVLGNPRVILYAGSPTEDASTIGASQGVPIPADWRDKLHPAANRADLAMPHHLLQIKTDDYTGLGDAAGCFHLGQLMHTLGRATNVTQSRFLNWDSVMRHNLIILGSPHTNDWAHGNVPNHDFRIVKMGITDEKPKPGGPELYPCEWDENGTAVADHGLIWSWQTPAGSRVLVLAGPSSAATGAMAELFSNPEKFRPIFEKIRSDQSGDGFPTNWQVLFAIDIRDNLPVRTTYVTHRLYPADS